MLRKAGVVVAVLFAVAIAPGTPVQLSYVHSDSMAPTLQPGDGYVVVPTGDVEPGEVITYRASERSGYITHRVVRETEGGFITKGDANPSTDQAAGHPPVAREQVVGEVLTVGGSPLVIPHLGTAVVTLRSHALLALLVALTAAAVATRESRSTRPDRDVLRVGDLVRPLFGVAIAVSLLVIVTSTHQASVVYVATNGEAAGAATVETGDAATLTRDVRLSVTEPTMAFITTDYGTIQGHRTVQRSEHGLVDREVRRVRVRIPPPERAGRRVVELDVHAYPRTLPRDVVRTLHTLHPTLAALGTTLAGYAPLVLGYLLLVDGARPLRLPRIRSLRRRLG